jgi:putative oxidoreductase
MTEQSLPARWPSYAPQLLSVLRIAAAIIFIQPGLVKLFGVPVGMPPNNATASVMTLPWIAGMLEIVGGPLLLVGLFTRPVAFILSGEMAVAYFLGHFPQSPWIVVNQGIPAALFCFVWLYFSAAGAGPWSLDALRGKSAVREVIIA